MCKALQDLYDEGVERGIKQKLFEWVKKKLAKGKNVAEIADELEEPLEVILPLCDQIEKELHSTT